jgi:hypothetical protein
MSSMSVLIPIVVFWLAIACVITIGWLRDTIKASRRPPAFVWPASRVIHGRKAGNRSHVGEGEKPNKEGILSARSAVRFLRRRATRR